MKIWQEERGKALTDPLKRIEVRTSLSHVKRLFDGLKMAVVIEPVLMNAYLQDTPWN